MTLQIKEKNSNGTSQIRQWFFSEIGFLIMFGGILVGAVLFVVQPINKIEINIATMQSDIATIKSGLSTHIGESKERDNKITTAEKEIALIKQFLKLK